MTKVLVCVKTASPNAERRGAGATNSEGTQARTANGLNEADTLQILIRTGAREDALDPDKPMNMPS